MSQRKQRSLGVRVGLIILGCFVGSIVGAFAALPLQLLGLGMVKGAVGGVGVACVALGGYLAYRWSRN
jgi:hypothetical protein